MINRFFTNEYLNYPINKHLHEIIWANVYNDSIRGREYLENLNLNIGRWAGNYAFFYVLNRILHDFNPKTILDVGLGESSRFIMTCLDNYLKETQHVVIEHDPKWIELYKERNGVSKNTSIIRLDLIEKKFKGHKTTSYKNFSNKVKGYDFDLIILDGPFGSKRYSRNDILSLVEYLDSSKEFIILFDDTNRKGERETFKILVNELTKKSISFNVEHYKGNKTVSVLATNKYKYVTSL